MAKRFFSKKTLALVLVLVMCFSLASITTLAAPWDREDNNWSYAYYLGQEYLGNAAGKPVKPDPVGYGFQGVITSLTFTDDAGKTWTFHWNYEANGEWRITGQNVSKSQATAWPKVTDGKRYTGYCGNKAYEFTLSLDGKAEGWTYANDSSRHANWFFYIRFIREYIVNVYYENTTGTILYNGIRYAAQAPLVREFEFLYPNGNIIDDSEYEDGEYTDPVKLLPHDYLTDDMVAQGYEIKHATDARGNDVLTTGVTISLLGDNVLNVYCTLIPPVTEDYDIIHTYYTDDQPDGTVGGGDIQVEEGAEFDQVVDTIEKIPSYDGNDYTYSGYEIDPQNNVIVLIYDRETPEPEVTEPEVTEPEVTEPEVTEPEVTEPEVTEPEVTEPEVTEPEVTEPEVTEPEVTEPEVTEPKPTTPYVEIPDDPTPLVEIPDEDVPLADVPKTGDPMAIYLAVTALSGIGLAALGVRKKKEDSSLQG